MSFDDQTATLNTHKYPTCYPHALTDCLLASFVLYRIIALGAASSDVLRLVMGKAIVLVAMGTVIGLAMGFALEQLMNSMLFNAGGVDVVAYIIVVPSLFLVAMLAAYAPARRASQIAPTQGLRYE